MIVDHLPHIEDLTASQLYNFLTKPISMSLKFDGAPSIVIGHDWVALKSSWKTKRYKTVEEIRNSDLNARVKDILISVYYYVLKLNRIAPGIIVQADVIAHKSMLLSTWKYQPNTLIYSFDTSQPLTLVIHSLSLEEGYEIPWKAITTEGSTIFIDPRREHSDSIFDGLRNINRYDIDPRVMKAIVRYRNYATKNNLPIYRLERDTFEYFIKDLIVVQQKSILNPGRVGKYSEWNELLDYSKMVDFDRLYAYTLAVLQHKNHILRTHINVPHIMETGIKVFVETDQQELLPATHEGLVLKGPDMAVKLVDRNEFSTYNFSKYIKKGFDR